MAENRTRVKLQKLDKASERTIQADAHSTSNLTRMITNMPELFPQSDAH